jgi:hypothetical protein
MGSREMRMRGETSSFLNPSGALLSTEEMNRVPTHTPLAPNINAAATDLPSLMPPAAIQSTD